MNKYTGTNKDKNELLKNIDKINKGFKEVKILREELVIISFFFKKFTFTT